MVRLLVYTLAKITKLIGLSPLSLPQGAATVSTGYLSPGTFFRTVLMDEQGSMEHFPY